MKKMYKAICTLALTLCLGMTGLAEGYKMDYEVTVTPQYEAAVRYSGGLAAVKQNGKWGYIDEEGTLVIAPQYDYAASFSEGKALVGTSYAEENTWSGEEISGLQFGIVDLSGNYKPLMVPTEEGGTEIFAADMYNYYNIEYGYDSETGTSYENVNGSRDYVYKNGYLSIPNGMEISADVDATDLIFDKNGNYVDGEITFTWGEGNEETLYLGGVYSDSLFIAEPTLGLDTPYTVFCTKDKEKVLAIPRWSHIASDGIAFNTIYEFSDGYAGAWGTRLYNDGNSWEDFFALLDKNGNIVFKGNYDYVQYYTLAADAGADVLCDGRICLRKTDTGLWGAVDMYGNEKVPFIYEEMYPFNEGLAAVKQNGLWGFVDVDNNVVIAPQYTRITNFNGGITLVEKDGVPTVIDRYNNVLEGGEKIPMDLYITEELVKSIGETIVIEENGLYGFAKLSYNTALPGLDEMSAWAYPEVCEAIQNNLVPRYLQNQYFKNIRRDDFAELIVRALEEVSGKDAEDLLMEKTGLSMSAAYAQNPFLDTNATSIIIANKLGIINGVSATAFAPSSQISRQDAAALLMRAAKLLKGDIEITGQTFADDANIADYAKQAVSYVTTLKIMNGVGEDRFDPTATYTREQAFVTIVRLFKSLQ